MLVHGFRGDHHGLERIAASITAGPVIVPDVPGFGESHALRFEDDAGGDALRSLGSWLAEFVDRVHDGPLVLVGHSFGTLIVSASLALGCRANEVVLINPISAPALSGPRAMLSQLTLQYYRLAARLPERAGNALLKSPLIVRAMSEIMTKTRDPELRAWIHSQHGSYFSNFHDRNALIRMFQASISNTVPDFLSAFTMPTTVIASDRDDITPLADQLRLVHDLPDGRLFIVPEVGHLVHYEQPDMVVEQIELAINRLLAESVQ